MQQVSERREEMVLKISRKDGQTDLISVIRYKVQVRSNHPKYENQLLKTSIL